MTETERMVDQFLCWTWARGLAVASADLRAFNRYYRGWHS